MKKFIKSIFSRERFTRVTLPIILVIILIIIGLFTFQNPKAKNLDVDQAKTKAETFINAYLMQGGNKATVKDITTEYGLYKLQIDIVSDVVESYLTKDGKLFFPQALDIEKMSNSTPSAETGATGGAVAEVSQKSDKPKVELFVMSYCPYGTQIEKGILPVVKALGNKIDYELKFVDYAMHGEEELTENLNQYCIQKEQPDKFNAYLECFLVAGDSASCLTSAGVSQSKLASCFSKTDNEFKIFSNFKDRIGYQGSYPGFDVNKADNAKYNVGGSPTLVINGQEISSGRDAASLLKTICSAFNNQPQECEASLSSATPAPGFGTGTQAAGAGAAACE
ncbi:MAG: hypothetical protein WC456_04210 [Patescibacteria group bacterium]